MTNKVILMIKIMEKIKPEDRAEDMVMQLGWRKSMTLCADFLFDSKTMKDKHRALYWEKVLNSIADMVDKLLNQNKDE